MSPAMAAHIDAAIMNPWMLAFVDRCHDTIRELLGENTVIASNINRPILKMRNYDEIQRHD